MWHRTFDARLASWNQLRTQSLNLSLTESLSLVNSWWFKSPWIPYHLHWDDQSTWPDPWQLLDDNLFCPLARGLGILYTIAMLERSDIQDAVLIEVGSDNLVLAANEKYILNWDSKQMLNITLERTKPRHSVTQQQIKQQIR
mgnify:CR=1 FL=1